MNAVTLDPVLDQVVDGPGCEVIFAAEGGRLCGLPDAHMTALRCSVGHPDRILICTHHLLLLAQNILVCTRCWQAGNRVKVYRAGTQ